MAQIKSFTDLQQSKKLAEILPIENADMKYFFWKDEVDKYQVPSFGYKKDVAESYKNTEAIYQPCWSLSALLDVIPLAVLDKFYNSEIKAIRWICTAFPENYRGLETNNYDNPVDACYDMILQLHELKML